MFARFSRKKDKDHAAPEAKIDRVEDLLKEYTRTYTFAELTDKNRPKGLDTTRLEVRFLPFCCDQRSEIKERD